MPLVLHIEPYEGFDSNSNEFITVKETTLQLEHSLISLKKWEQKYHIPFLDEDKEKTTEQWLYYIECMNMTQNVDPNVFKYMSVSNIEKVTEYIKDPMTATWFTDSKENKRKKKEVITAEIIYYWMIELNVPPQYEKWHLNQLLTLIRVINVKHDTSKMGKKEQAMQRSALNAQRRARSHSRG
jgi:hypothetical protein